MFDAFEVGKTFGNKNDETWAWKGNVAEYPADSFAISKWIKQEPGGLGTIWSYSYWNMLSVIFYNFCINN